MRQKKIIECCIVEDHYDIVPFIQSLLRAKKIKNVPIRMLHFDSHPDISVPTNLTDQTNTHDWKDFNKLWDILNQFESGISEFIIPLICNNIISNVTWVKPRWSSQFDVGSHQFTVGNIKYNRNAIVDYNNKHVASSRRSHNTASDNDTLVAAISTKHPYYLGDHVLCDDEDMVPTDKIDIVFNVVELTSDYSTFKSPPENSHKNSNSSSTNYNCSIDSTSEQWMLDICLDYFSAYNPIILELQSLLLPCLSTFDLTSISHLLPKRLTTTTFTLFSTTPTTSTPTTPTTTTTAASTDPSSVCGLPCLNETYSETEGGREIVVMDRLIYIIQAVFKLLPTSTHYFTTDNNDGSSSSNNDIDVDTNKGTTHPASKRAKSNGHNYDHKPSSSVHLDQPSNKQHAIAYRAALAVIDRLFKHSLLSTDDTVDRSSNDDTDDEYMKEKDKLHEEFLGLYYYSDRPLMAGFLTHVLPYLPIAVKR